MRRAVRRHARCAGGGPPSARHDGRMTIPGAWVRAARGAMLLSPDGTRVAVGDHDLERPDLVVVDLESRTVKNILLPIHEYLIVL